MVDTAQLQLGVGVALWSEKYYYFNKHQRNTMSADAQVKKLEELLAKVEQQVTRIEGKLKGSSGSASSGGASGGSSAASKEFGNLVADHLPKFLEAANKIGGEVAQQVRKYQICKFF